MSWVKALAARPVPPLPDWVAALPLVGQRLATEWEAIAAARPEDLAASVTPYLAGAGAWLLAQAGSVGALFVQLLLTVAVSALLYARGEVVVAGVLSFARRLAGDAGERVVILSAGGIRGVALGIVVTALLRPALIRKGADLPFVLIFTGVLGGMLAFGLIGLFVGPVVLAVTYPLLVAWVAEGDSPPV